LEPEVVSVSAELRERFQTGSAGEDSEAVGDSAEAAVESKVFVEKELVVVSVESRSLHSILRAISKNQGGTRPEPAYAGV
jgi:hypothetical protein